MASERRKLPAGIAKFGILGWLCHVKVFSLQHGLLHVVVTTTSVLIDFASTRGPSDLQEWQYLNNRSNCVQKTTYFGSVHKLPSVTGKLQQENVV